MRDSCTCWWLILNTITLTKMKISPTGQGPDAPRTPGTGPGLPRAVLSDLSGRRTWYTGRLGATCVPSGARPCRKQGWDTTGGAPRQALCPVCRVPAGVALTHFPPWALVEGRVTAWSHQHPQPSRKDSSRQQTGGLSSLGQNPFLTGWAAVPDRPGSLKFMSTGKL
jgi:hypothetical protein